MLTIMFYQEETSEDAVTPGDDLEELEEDFEEDGEEEEDENELA